MVGPGAKVGVAVSGGVDSWVLLEVLRRRQRIVPFRFDIMANPPESRLRSGDTTPRSSSIWRTTASRGILRVTDLRPARAFSGKTAAIPPAFYCAMLRRTRLFEVCQQYRLNASRLWAQRRRSGHDVLYEPCPETGASRAWACATTFSRGRSKSSGLCFWWKSRISSKRRGAGSCRLVESLPFRREDQPGEFPSQEIGELHGGRQDAQNEPFQRVVPLAAGAVRKREQGMIGKLRKAIERKLSVRDILSYAAITLQRHWSKDWGTLALRIKARLFGVEVGSGVTACGSVILGRWPAAHIRLGAGCSLISSSRRATASTLYAPVRLRTYAPTARIELAEGVQLSGTGDHGRARAPFPSARTPWWGPNCVITDSDFHAHWPSRRHGTSSPPLSWIAAYPIGANVWIGMNALYPQGRDHRGRGHSRRRVRRRPRRPSKGRRRRGTPPRL